MGGSLKRASVVVTFLAFSSTTSIAGSQTLSRGSPASAFKWYISPFTENTEPKDSNLRHRDVQLDKFIVSSGHHGQGPPTLPEPNTSL